MHFWAFGLTMGGISVGSGMARAVRQGTRGLGRGKGQGIGDKDSGEVSSATVNWH